MDWTEQQIEAAWDRGEVVERIDPGRWRKDACGAWICREHYGNPNSRYGWEIDPLALPAGDGGGNGGTLQPFQWKNAAFRKEGKPSCPVIGCGGDNLDFG
jgi:hypothetical protein